MRARRLISLEQRIGRLTAGGSWQVVYRAGIVGEVIMITGSGCDCVDYWSLNTSRLDIYTTCRRGIPDTARSHLVVG
jgi:hypothetical protein